MIIFKKMAMLSLLLLLQVVGSAAFFRMECPGRLAIARMDPLMAPGKVSQHAHAIYGSNGFDMSSDYDELRAGNCTSCRVKMDMSSYWHPQLYFKDAETGQFEQVEPKGGMLAYYLIPGQNVTAFPAGFRMIAGDNNLHKWDLPFSPTISPGEPGGEPQKSLWFNEPWFNEDGRRKLALGVNCLKAKTEDGTVEGAVMRHYLPNKRDIDTCTGGLRFELVFPSCWDGKALDSKNHKDHVRYADLVLDGGCNEAAKDGYPIQLPTLMYEIFYDTMLYMDRKGEYVVANGDQSGMAYHGDFMSGWDVQELQSAIDVCTNESGRIEDCPIFDPVRVSKEEAMECKLKSPNFPIDEDVVGPIDSLPGGVKLFAIDPALGDRPMMPQVGVDPNLAPVADPALDNPVAPVANPVYSGGDGLGENVSAPETTALPFPTVGGEEEYYSTQFVTDGHRVTKILWVQELVTATETVAAATTVTLESEPTGGARKARRDTKRHAAHHHHGALHRHRL